jgi:Cdc6-like AAA superfamily ATPase
MKRAWKRLKWEPEDIRHLRSRISANIGLLNAFTSRITRENVATLVRDQADQTRQTILNWITPIDFAPQQSDFISRRQAGTGQWLLDSAEFARWRESSGQTLFGRGIPGAGKTILTSIVVAEVSAQFENDASVGIAYLFCNYQRQHEQKLGDLLASLLKQLTQEQQCLPDEVKTLYEQHRDKRTRPSPSSLTRVLRSVTAAYSRIFIVVDALDECSSDGCRQELLSALFDLRERCGANLLITSRPISSIEAEFEASPTLEIRASDEDVRRYLEGSMCRLPGFVVRSPDLQEEIKTKIIEAVDGK